MGLCILFPLGPTVDCILLGHVLHGFDCLCRIWDELPEEVYLTQEGLHHYLVGWVRDMCNSSDLTWINLNPSFNNCVSEEVPLKHYKYAIFGIQKNPIYPPSLKKFLQMAYVVVAFPWEHNHIIEVYYYTLSNESMEGDVHGALKACTCIHKPK